jgi:biopolymer transport protein ExbD
MLNNQASPYFSASRRAVDDSNMIPLINIVFLLLIFFMVAGTIASGDAAPFDAPHSQATTVPRLETTSIVLAADRSLWLDDQPWGALEELTANDWQQLQNQLAEKRSILLKADANLPATTLDPLLKHLRASGLGNIQLAVDQTP